MLGLEGGSARHSRNLSAPNHFQEESLGQQGEDKGNVGGDHSPSSGGHEEAAQGAMHSRLRDVSSGADSQGSLYDDDWMIGGMDGLTGEADYLHSQDDRKEHDEGWTNARAERSSSAPAVRADSRENGAIYIGGGGTVGGSGCSDHRGWNHTTMELREDGDGGAWGEWDFAMGRSMEEPFPE